MNERLITALGIFTRPLRLPDTIALINTLFARARGLEAGESENGTAGPLETPPHSQPPPKHPKPQSGESTRTPLPQCPEPSAHTPSSRLAVRQ